MREKIIDIIYEQFALFSQNTNAACTKGCSTCCTQNVTVTATEAEKIFKFAVAQGKEEWFSDILATKRDSVKPPMTTNDFARACLEGREVDPGENDNFSEPCLFLEDGICQIYDARPFSCRAFISRTQCTANSPALVSDNYAATITALNQVIEHVGQKEHWGNLFDVLIAISDISAYKECAQKNTVQDLLEARGKTLTAQPLAGFLLTEENLTEAQDILESIFSATIDGKTVENILNGK